MLYKEEREQCQLIAMYMQEPDANVTQVRENLRGKLASLIYYYVDIAYKTQVVRVEIPTFIFTPMQMHDYGGGPALTFPSISANDIIITVRRTRQGRKLTSWKIAVHPPTEVVRTNAYGYFGSTLENIGQGVIERVEKYYKQLEKIIAHNLKA